MFDFSEGFLRSACQDLSSQSQPRLKSNPSFNVQVLSWLLPQEDEEEELLLGRAPRRRTSPSSQAVATFVETMPALHNSLVCFPCKLP